MNANDLLNTTALPPGFLAARTLARKAKAYHNLRPYPFVAFQDWKTEDRGPYPVCRPFVRRIVKLGARWLFGQPVRFKADQDKDLTELLNQTWNDASMGSRAVGFAERAAVNGAVDLKWSLPDPQTGLVTIEDYDPTEHTRLYFDPADKTKLLMARIQVPQFDFTDKKWYWYREEWTDDYRVVYKRVIAAKQDNGTAGYNPYEYVEEIDKKPFEVETQEANIFGIVPFWRLRNADSGDEWGLGDLWPYWQSVDQINFNRDLEHKDNQKKIDPDIALIDLQQPANEQPGSDSGPVQERVLESTDGKDGKIVPIESGHDIRQHIDQFADKLKDELLNAVGSVELDPESVTNKGNLTPAVYAQIYAPLIETTNEKRGLYGEDGLSVFWERACQGLANAKVQGWKPTKSVETVWPRLLPANEEELNTAVQRQAAMVESAFTTHERATRHIASLDGVVDVDELLQETAPLKEELDRKADESHEATVNPQQAEA